MNARHAAAFSALEAYRAVSPRFAVLRSVTKPSTMLKLWIDTGKDPEHPMELVAEYSNARDMRVFIEGMTAELRLALGDPTK